MSNERVPLLSSSMMMSSAIDDNINFPYANHMFNLKTAAAIVLAMVIGSTLDRTLDYLADILMPDATKSDLLKVWWAYVGTGAVLLFLLIHIIERCKHKHAKQQKLQLQTNGNVINSSNNNNKYNPTRGLRATS